MVLFRDVWEQHAPATSILAALAQRLFPLEPAATARLLNLLTVGAITVLVYRIAARLAGSWLAGVAAALCWAWWEPVYGNVMFYFDTLMGLCLCAALYLWLGRGTHGTPWRVILTGAAMGLATLAKQHAWAALIVFGLYVLRTERRLFPAYIAGALLPPVILVVCVILDGTFAQYFYWNWAFNFSGLMDGALPRGDLLRKLLLSNLPVIMLIWPAYRRKVPEWRLLLLLWGSATLTLLPRFTLVQGMAHLPLAAVITGLVIAPALKSALERPFLPVAALLRRARPWKGVSPLIGMIGAATGLLILWTGLVVYIPNPLGRGAIPAYDEFRPLVTALTARSKTDDTLFVLPETDSTPQLHVLTGLLPPGTWVKGWRWYLEVPGLTDHLLKGWLHSPPDWVILFPDFAAESLPAIGPLLAWLEENYHAVETVEEVLFHGDAVLYRRNDPRAGH